MAKVSMTSNIQLTISDDGNCWLNTGVVWNTKTSFELEKVCSKELVFKLNGKKSQFILATSCLWHKAVVRTQKITQTLPGNSVQLTVLMFLVIYKLLFVPKVGHYPILIKIITAPFTTSHRGV